MLVLLDIGGNWTTRLLEDLLKPSGGVRRRSLVQILAGEASSKPGLVYIIG